MALKTLSSTLARFRNWLTVFQPTTFLIRQELVSFQLLQPLVLLLFLELARNQGMLHQFCEVFGLGLTLF